MVCEGMHGAGSGMVLAVGQGVWSHVCMLYGCDRVHVQGGWRRLLLQGWVGGWRVGAWATSAGEAPQGQALGVVSMHVGALPAHSRWGEGRGQQGVAGTCWNTDAGCLGLW
jgi:hypothetical protein